MVSVLLDLNIWLMSVLEIQTNFTPFVACFYYFWYVQVIIKLNPGPRKNNTSYNFSFCLWNLNPTQDENFRGFSRMRGRGPKKPPPTLKSVTHILQWWNVAVIPYLKKIQKKKWITWYTEFCWHQHFFHRKSANFVISRNTDIDCILVHNF